MKRKYLALSRLLTALVFGAFLHCVNPASTLTDAEQVAALRKVTVSCDSLTYTFGLPPGALGGKSFAELLAQDSATYADPANYSISVLCTMTADNTKADAEDAKFDGMNIGVVMDTLASTPIQTVAEPFTVSKGSKKAVVSRGTINLATHRKAGLYIFRQTVAGADLATTIKPELEYKIGSAAGTIPLPDIKQNIPTRASAETKAFLAGLIASGIFGSVVFSNR